MSEQYFYFIFELFSFYSQVYLDYQLLIFLKIKCKFSTQKSHFYAFIFSLNLSRNLALLYIVCRFAQRNCARYVTVSVPYLTVFVFFAKTSWKFLMLRVLQWNWKREFIIGGAITFTILYTSVIKTFKFYLMNCYLVLLS